MSSFNKDDVEKNLKKKGFKEKDNDHKFYHYYTLSGKKTSIITKTSHSGKDINDSLIKFMSRQIKVTMPFFKEFIRCTKNQDDYETFLINNNILKPKT